MRLERHSLVSVVRSVLDSADRSSAGSSRLSRGVGPSGSGARHACCRRPPVAEAYVDLSCRIVDVFVAPDSTRGEPALAQWSLSRPPTPYLHLRDGSYDLVDWSSVEMANCGDLATVMPEQKG